jgi:hypothetical protein
MTDNSSRSPASAALLDIEPDLLRCATCPMCHTPSAVTQNAIEAGADWRCTTCGQHWDAGRLTAVAAYAAWRVEHDRAGSRATERNRNPAPDGEPTDRQ